MTQIPMDITRAEAQKQRVKEEMNWEDNERNEAQFHIPLAA